jgi:tetrapyrrole methylase family protein/MazG family protein
MQEFDRLLDIIQTLRGPSGCEWDKAQTLKTMTPGLIEEAYEAVEAIENESAEDMQEEFGDLLFLAAFVSRVGEEEGLFRVEDVVKGVADKLVRRHPHVFGDSETKDVDVILRNWEKIKLSEKKNRKRKTPFDGIPKGMPELQRFEKVLEKIRREKTEIRSVEDAELERSLDLYLARPDDENSEAFLEAFLVHAFHHKLDLSRAVRAVTAKTVSAWNEVHPVANADEDCVKDGN